MLHHSRWWGLLTFVTKGGWVVLGVLCHIFQNKFRSSSMAILFHAMLAIFTVTVNHSTWQHGDRHTERGTPGK